jgi:hypothetical protein
MVPKGRVLRTLDADRVHEGSDFKLKQYCWLTAGTLDAVDHLDELWLRSTFNDDEPWTALPLLRRTGAGVPVAVTRANIVAQRNLQEPPQPVRSQLGVLDALQSDDIHIITAIMDGQSGELEPVWPTIKGSAELAARRKEKIAEKNKKKRKQLGVLQQAFTVPAVALPGAPHVEPAEGGAADARTTHVVHLEDAGGGGSGAAAAADDDGGDDDDDDYAEGDEPDSDDDDGGQGANASGGGAGGGAKGVEVPRTRIRIGRVFVPDCWKSGDVLRCVGVDGGMLDLAPSGELSPGQMVTFELP